MSVASNCCSTQAYQPKDGNGGTRKCRRPARKPQPHQELRFAFRGFASRTKLRSTAMLPPSAAQKAAPFYVNVLNSSLASPAAIPRAGQMHFDTADCDPSPARDE